MSAFDRQVGGAHYRQGKIQPLEFILSNNLGFVEGVVIKYLVRHQTKNRKEDIEKCIHYLEMLLEKYDEVYPPILPLPEIKARM